METTAGVLEHLRAVARKTNERLAPQIGIPVSTAITANKPEGSTSQKTLTSSGIHPWHNDYYIRTVRADKKDPMTRFMIDAGFPWEDDAMNPSETAIFSFPIAAPEGAITRNDITALEHLDLWLTYQRSWCEHKPSVTINVKDDEWKGVGEWVFENFDEVTGIAFLPHSEHTYVQAPYQDITAEEYAEWTYKMPIKVDWSLLSSYELEDSTTSMQELACSASGSGCDVIEIGTIAA